MAHRRLQQPHGRGVVGDVHDDRRGGGGRRPASPRAHRPGCGTSGVASGSLRTTRSTGEECPSPEPWRSTMQMTTSWLKPTFWGVVLGSILTMILGFGWGGWVLGGTAERMALERTNSAMVVSLTPACVARFMQQANATAKLR